MKKVVGIVAGIVVVTGVVLVGRPDKSGESDGLEGTQSASDQLRRDTGEGISSGGAGSIPSSADAEVSFPNEESPESANSVANRVLSDPVKALLGIDKEKHNYPSLLSELNDLGDEISADDVSALMEMLAWPNDRFPEGMRSIEINAVKNEALDKLLRQKELPAGLGRHMVEMAGNADNDPVWRDYCIQFMTPFYERATGETTKYAEDTKRAVEGASVSSVPSSVAGGKKNELSAVHDAMFAALDERTETLAGTSLIGLELLSRTHDEFDRELIVTKATEIASDEMASSASRMTALRLSAQISNTEQGISNDEVVDSARALAQTGETVLLRSSAIVTLGEVGTADDRELLVSFTVDDNRQIAAAAELALQKMDQEPTVAAEVAIKPISLPQVTEKLPPVLIN